jgi:3,5-epimerase/4-reductase
MKIMTLGQGFIAKHLPYPQITDRLIPWNSYIRTTLDHYQPDVLINCIGFTGRPNIDQCETHQSETYLANVILPGLIATECQQLNIHHIMIGSGCIFFGQSPHFVEGQDLGWKETDFANPQSYYSQTKYACDLLLGNLPNHTTLRIRMPVSPRNESRNFINKIKGYRQIIDLPNSMTFTDDLVACIDWVAREHKTGLYHVVNPGALSAADVLREYQKYHPQHIFQIIDENQLNQLTLAKRSNCVLNIDKLTQAGFTMTPSREALTICMEKFVLACR